MVPNSDKDQLKMTSTRLIAIFETVSDCLITIDESGIIETINPATTRLFQYEADELLGQNVNRLMPSPHREQHDTYLKRYQQTRIPKVIGTGREELARKKDGTIFPIRLVVNEVVLEDRTIYAGIIHDRSLQKEAEEKILAMNGELEAIIRDRSKELSKTIDELSALNLSLKNEIRERKEAEETILQQELELKQLLAQERDLTTLKSRFITMASHQFRTPLSTILSSSELIEKYRLTEDQPKREKHVHRIRQSVVNLSNMLNDFFSVKNLEDNKIENHPEYFKFDALATELQVELQQLLKTGQTVVCDDQTKEVEIYLDRHLLKSILRNLLSNAIKYSNEGQVVACRASIVGNTLTISVQDQGMGVPAADIPHLFERFYRASNAENIQGTGLGLYIVKRYVEIMKGSIKLLSKNQQGSTFQLQFQLE